MKTRIIHTQFWDDSYILKLSPKEKLLFIFYFTNSRCGQTPYYEISPEITKFVTGLTLKEIEEFKVKFQADKKYIFVEDWVYISNGEKYQNYKGEKNETAYNKEYLLIPQQIKEKVDTLLEELDSVPIGYRYPIDTLINHKSEIINNKLINNKYKNREEITELVLQEISDKYQVPVGFVENCWDTAQNWLDSSGKTKKDYKAFLSNWVKSDIEKRKEVQNGKPRAIDAERIIRERKMGSQSEQRSLHS